MNKQSASTALEESPSSRAAASPHNELLMRFPLSGQLISISPDMRFQRTGIFKLLGISRSSIYYKKVEPSEEELLLKEQLMARIDYHLSLIHI